jgi:hypothetical protein
MGIRLWKIDFYDRKLSAELYRVRHEIEALQEDHLATVMPPEVTGRIEDVLFRLAELTGALREAGL